MTKPAFTPGPWDCTGCQFPDDDMGGVYYRVQAEGMNASGANAHLIAASPDLYEALAAATTCMSALQVFPGPAGQELLATCEAALAKARGEQL